ncbi:ATP-dependent RNA helicase, partial [Enterococcus faecalis]
GGNGKGGSYRGNKNHKDGDRNYKNSDRKNKDQRGGKRHNDKKRGFVIRENAK